MGTPKVPLPAKLVISIIFSSEGLINKAKGKLEEIFGKIDFVSEKLPFDYTDYYTKEMGKGLFRRFVSFAEPISRERLSEVKLITNRIEKEFSTFEGKRRLNIDPGFLALEHFILATTKSYTHRPYLKDGIYVDLTLIYEKGSYRALKWTYPDYASEEIINILNTLRKEFIDDLKRRKLL